MSQIDYAFAELNTNQVTTSATYVGVTGVSIASGFFTAGKKYLIYATAQFQAADNIDGLQARLIHGSTAFAGSESYMLYTNIGVNERTIYGYATVWEAVGGEAVTLQYRSRTGTTNANCNFASLFVLNLTDDLVENVDWFFNENTTSTGLTTTYADFASLTFTPPVADQDWLVLATGKMDTGGQATTFVKARIHAGATTVPEVTFDVTISARSDVLAFMARVYTLAASSQTIKYQAATTPSGTAGNHYRSGVFALNLNKFKNHAFAYTEAAAALSTTDYATQLQTASLTPDVEGPVWMGHYWTFDNKQSARVAKHRLQVDNADQPAGQTTAAYWFQASNDPSLEAQMLSTVATLTASAHTLDLDASVDTTGGTPEGQERTIWAVTLELAAVVPAPALRLVTSNLRFA